MQSRAARLILLGLFLIAISTAAFLFWRGDTEASNAALQAKTFDATAKAIERRLLDLRAAQLGYAAANQPADRWVGRVAHGLETVRMDIQELRAGTTAPAAQTALDAATTALNNFAKADKRAADYIKNEQRVLASDVVFGDGLEQSEAALAAVEKGRAAEVEARESVVPVFRSRQVFALTAGAGAAVLVVLLLVPVARAAPATAPAQLTKSTEPVKRGPAIPESIRPVDALEDTVDDGVVSLPRSVNAPEPMLASLAVPDVQAIPAGDAAPLAQAAAGPPDGIAPVTDFAGVASLCVDLARVVDTRALPSLLDRTAALLDASGIILWIADPDGRELNPIFAQGYPQQLVNRLGTIPRDAENATAAAFRTSLLQTVMADEISGGAIAAPLVTPGGCVGVMAAEVRHDSERQDAKLAAATIVAAQLATLVGPPSARAQSKTASGA
jgi:CHASE3 domain sensor protein